MYTFQQAADAARICMKEIAERGLKERKILLKTEQSSFLLNKFIKEKVCSGHDLRYESIHRVATLMKDILWLCPERIISRKAWRSINYQTCMIENLASIMTENAMTFLLELMDFLLMVMSHKSCNLMTARRLGEAMGKVTFGPRDCNPMMAERCSNLVTKLLIERSRKNGNGREGVNVLTSDRTASPVIAERSARLASKKSFERIAQKANDWSNNLAGVLDLFEPDSQQHCEDDLQYVSIFTTELSPTEIANGDPTLIRIVRNINENCFVEPCQESVCSEDDHSYEYSETIVNDLEIMDLPSIDTLSNVQTYPQKHKGQSKRFTWSLGEILGAKQSIAKESRKSKDLTEKSKARPKSLITGVNRQITRIRSLKNLSFVSSSSRDLPPF